MASPVSGSWKARWARLRWSISWVCRAALSWRVCRVSWSAWRSRSAARVSASRATVLSRSTSSTASTTVHAMIAMSSCGWDSVSTKGRPRLETSGLISASARNSVTRLRSAVGTARSSAERATLGCRAAAPIRTDQASQPIVATALVCALPAAWSSR
nr:hypothetical protein GCM10020093_120480 [Planobispora longispora]